MCEWSYHNSSIFCGSPGASEINEAVHPTLNWLAYYAGNLSSNRNWNFTFAFIYSLSFCRQRRFFLSIGISAAMTGHFFRPAWLICLAVSRIFPHFSQEANIWRASHNWIPIKPQITSKLHYLLSAFAHSFLFSVSRHLIAKHFRYFSHVRVLPICQVNATMPQYSIPDTRHQWQLFAISLPQHFVCHAINFWLSFFFFSNTHLHNTTKCMGVDKPPESFVWLAISMGVTETLRSRGDGKKKSS